MSIISEPQCLIGTDQNGQLHVVDTTLQQIKDIDKPIVVVAIAGLYRTGKSYLMNRLTGKNAGFALGSTIQSKTKGIWIWAIPHPKQKDKYLLLLDTEGLGDAEKGDANHDTWIFSLATLLSSVLVYNALGAINDDAIGKLNFVAEMSKHIRTKQPGSNKDENLDWYFPDFIYAVRDFNLELEKDGKAITEDEYLEHCLTLNPDKDEAFNTPRRCLRRYFKSRKCFTFDRPGGKKVLKKLDTVSDADLSEDFLEDSKRFCTHILQNGSVKKLDNGQVLNGTMWTTLVRNYVEAIRRGDVPCIESAITAMAKIENEKAILACVESYRQKILDKVKLPTADDHTLSKLHSGVLTETIKMFLSKSVCDDDGSFQRKLTILLGEEYQTFVRHNHEASREKCESLLSNLEKPVRKKISDGFYSRPGGYGLYSADVEQIQKKYLAEGGLGVKMKEVLLDFMNKKMEEGKGILAADNQITEKERIAAAERKKKLEAEQQREKAEREKEIIQQRAEEREKAILENMKQLEAKQAREMAELKKHHTQVMNSRMAEQKRLLEEGYRRESEALRKEVEESNRRQEEIHREEMENLRQSQDERFQHQESLYKQEIEKMKRENEERFDEQQSWHEMEMDRVRVESERTIREYQDRYKEQIDALMARKDEEGRKMREAYEKAIKEMANKPAKVIERRVEQSDCVII